MASSREREIDAWDEDVLIANRFWGNRLGERRRWWAGFVARDQPPTGWTGQPLFQIEVVLQARDIVIDTVVSQSTQYQFRRFGVSIGHGAECFQQLRCESQFIV